MISPVRLAGLLQEKIMKILLKKSKGSGIGDILATCLCLLVIMTIIITGVYFFKLMEIKKDINSEARAGILILEQSGKLTNENIDNIKSSISKLGFKKNSIKITYNNDNTVAGYGEEVTIVIEAVASNEELGIPKILSFFKKEHTIKTELYSIAKTET